MYSSMRKQGRIHNPGGGTVAINPISSGRDGLPSADPKELDGIELAMLRGNPLYILQHANGSVYDVLTDKPSALKDKQEKVENIPKFNFYDALDNAAVEHVKKVHIRPSVHASNNIKLYERRAGFLFSV